MLSNGAGLKVPGGKCGYLKEYERENAEKKPHINFSNMANAHYHDVWLFERIIMQPTSHNFSLT